MDDIIKQAIKLAYPTGKLEEPDYSKFDLETTEKNVMDMIKRFNSSELLNIEPGIFFRFYPHIMEFSITPKHDFLSSDWTKTLSNKEKISWLKKSNRDFIIWHIKISLLCPFWHSFYNSWHQRDDTEFLDGEIPKTAPNELWCLIEEEVKKIFEINRYIHLSITQLREEVTFVQELEFSEDDDDEDGYYDNTTVGHCLFSPQ